MAVSVKNIFLITVALVLAVLVYLDYSGDESDSPATAAADAGTMEKVQKLARIVNSERAINDAYGQMALPYAQRIALMDTFTVEKGEPGAQLENVIRQLAEQYEATVEQLSIGTPQLLSDGVFWLQADVEISSLSSNGIWSIFLTLAEHQRGFTWKSFKLRALTDEKKVLLSGQLAAVLVQAAE